jgi:antitoxin component YwqK of YwqJK toxin-antitoxin module
MIEAQFITDLQEESPQTTIINCTGKGMRVQKVKNSSLRDAAATYCSKPLEVRDFLHAIIQNAAMPWVTKDKIVGLFHEWVETLERCIAIADQLKNEINRLMLECEAGAMLAEMRPYSGKQALLETELLEEEGYRFLLQDFHYVIETMAMARRHQLKCHPEQFSEKELQLLKLEIELNYYNYYASLAKDHIALIHDVLAVFEQEEALLDILRPHPPLPEQPEYYPFADKELFVDVKVPLSQYPQSIPSNVPYAEISLEQEGKRHGQCIWLYPDGTLFSERYYRNGVLHGPIRFYSKNGILLSESYYVDGKKEGTSKWYDDHGKLYAQLFYRHGLPHGFQKYYHNNGYPKSLLPFHDGILDGDVLLFHRNGQKKRQMGFKQGMLDGTESGWDAAGKQIFEAHYRQGQPFGVSRSWHPNGQLQREVTYHADPTKYDLYEWDEVGTLVNKQSAVPAEDFDQPLVREKRMIGALAAYELELRKILSQRGSHA